MTNGNKAVEKVKSEVAKTKTMSVQDLIRQNISELGKALPAHMNPERLGRIALTTMRLTPKLFECTAESFIGALFQSAQLGLEPGVGGQAHIIPYANKKKINGQWKTKMEAQFQIGYPGWVELFYRHEKAVSLFMETVRENDLFDYSYGTDSYLKHRAADVGRGEATHFYVIATLKDGGKEFKVMSHEECMEHGKKHSKCWVNYKWENGKKVTCDYHFDKSSPWAKEPEAMCMKTVLIQLMKNLPKSVEIRNAVAMDSTTKSKVRVNMLEVPDETNWNEDGSQDVKAEVVNEKETVNKDTETEKALDELEQLRQELKDDIIFRNVLGKSFGVENTDELTDKQRPAFKKEIRAIIDDLENIKS